MRKGAFEVHTHAYVSGPRSNLSGVELVHSHEGGNEPHQHPTTGPACYTIDKDEWRRATGMRGGGRKKFTATPTGEQLPIAELEEWQKGFVVILDESAKKFAEENGSTGAGVSPAARMVLGSRVNVISVTESDAPQVITRGGAR